MIWANYEYEDSFRAKGYYLIAGADEVGRGSLAGPLMVGMVALPVGCDLQVADSKLLSAKRREELSGRIKEQATAWSIGIVEAGEIDEYGLSAALKLAYERALEQFDPQPGRLVIDGPHKIIDHDFVEPIVKADQKIASVSAASIIAKVARDEWMHAQHKAYPEYGFATNVGYGSAQHLAALREHGPCLLHRLSFKVKSRA